MFKSWKETSLPTLLSNYGLKDIYNADESGLFCKCTTTCQLKSEKCSGGKLSKVHITSTAVINAVGVTIPILVIEKAQKPRCFKNVNFFLSNIDIKKKDNCPAHTHIENLKSIKLFFLPPNTTSTTQPMNQGVIRSLKAKYRKNTVQKIIRSLEKNNVLP